MKNVAENGLTDIIGKRRKVYNITVEDTPEYFANGVLVHNCWDSTTGENHFVFATLYYWLAMQGRGAGQFWREATQSDIPSVLGADNIYDISNAFRENNG